MSYARRASLLILLLIVAGAATMAVPTTRVQAATTQQHVKISTDVTLSRQEGGDCYGFIVGFYPASCYFVVEIADPIASSYWVPPGAPNITGTISFSWKTINGGAISIVPDVCTLDSYGACNVNVTATAGGLVALTGTYSGDENYYNSTTTNVLVIPKRVPGLELSCGIIELPTTTNPSATGTTDCTINGISYQYIGGNFTWSSGTLVDETQTNDVTCGASLPDCSVFSASSPGTYHVTVDYSGSNYAVPEILETEVLAVDGPAPQFTSSSPTLSCWTLNTLPEIVGQNATCNVLGADVTTSNTNTVVRSSNAQIISINGTSSTTCSFSGCALLFGANGAGTASISLTYSGDTVTGASSVQFIMPAYYKTPGYYAACDNLLLSQSCKIQAGETTNEGFPVQMNVSWSGPSGTTFNNTGSYSSGPLNTCYMPHPFPYANVSLAARLYTCGITFAGSRSGPVSITATIRNSHGYSFGTTTMMAFENWANQSFPFPLQQELFFTEHGLPQGVGWFVNVTDSSGNRVSGGTYWAYDQPVPSATNSTLIGYNVPGGASYAYKVYLTYNSLQNYNSPIIAIPSTGKIFVLDNIPGISTDNEIAMNTVSVSFFQTEYSCPAGVGSSLAPGSPNCPNIQPITVGGTVASPQLSNVTLSKVKGGGAYVLGFGLTGPPGNQGNLTLTIPQVDIPSGFAPTVYFDGGKVNATMSHVSGAYQVTFGVHFSTDSVEIVFQQASNSLTGIGIPALAAGIAPGILELPIALLAILLVAVVVLATRRLTPSIRGLYLLAAFGAVQFLTLFLSYSVFFQAPTTSGAAQSYASASSAGLESVFALTAFAFAVLFASLYMIKRDEKFAGAQSFKYPRVRLILLCAGYAMLAGGIAALASTLPSGGQSSASFAAGVTLIEAFGLLGIGGLLVLITFLFGAVPALWKLGVRSGTRFLRVAAVLEIPLIFALGSPITSMISSAMQSLNSSVGQPVSGSSISALPEIVFLAYIAAFAASGLVIAGAIGAKRSGRAPVTAGQILDSPTRVAAHNATMELEFKSDNSEEKAEDTAPTNSSAPRSCPSCGVALFPDSKFCAACGKKLT